MADDTDAINQAAGNIQVDGNWVSPIQAAALQSTQPDSITTAVNAGISGQYTPPVGPAGTPLQPETETDNAPAPYVPPPVQPVQTAPINVLQHAPAQPQAPMVPTQVQVGGTVGAPGTNSTNVTPGAAPIGTAGATPWSGTAIPNNVGFVPTGQPKPSSPSPAAVTPPAPKQGGGGGTSSDKLFQQTGAAETAAAKEQAAYETKLAGGQAAVGQDLSAQQGQQIDQSKLIAQQTQQQVQDSLARAKTIADNFQNQQIDPNRYWGKMGTGDHVLAGLSMILSGIGSGIQGKDNLAVKHFDDAQTNDIAAQRYNIEHGKDASEMYTNLAKEFQAAGLAKTQALDATGLAIRQKALTDASNQALQLGGPKAQADLDAKIAPIKLELAQQQAKLIQDHATTSNIQAETRLKNAQITQMGIQTQNSAVERSAEAKMANGATLDQLTPAEQQVFKVNHQKEAIPLPNGKVIYAQDEASQGKAMDANEKFQAIDAALAGYAQKIQSGASYGDREATASTARNIIGANMGLSREAGAVEGTENALSEAIPTHNFVEAHTVDTIDNQDARDLARINAARVVLRQSHEGVLRARARPGQVAKEVKDFKTGG